MYAFLIGSHVVVVISIEYSLAAARDAIVARLTHRMTLLRKKTELGAVQILSATADSVNISLP